MNITLLYFITLFLFMKIGILVFSIHMYLALYEPMSTIIKATRNPVGILNLSVLLLLGLLNNFLYSLIEAKSLVLSLIITFQLRYDIYPNLFSYITNFFCFFSNKIENKL